MNTFLKCYIIFVSLIGTLFIILCIIRLINSIIKSITFHFSNKEITEKLNNSTIAQDIFGKMTDEERKELEETGEAKSILNLDLDSLKVTKKTK